MVFWKRELRELEASGHRFEDIFRIFSTEYHQEKLHNT